jgi:carbamoyltransferase
MDKKILGISAYYHDSAAALVAEGKIVAAAQEERFTRIKHDHNFPINAVNYCLEEAGIATGDLDFVVFYEKPFLKFDRILETYLAYVPQGLKSFLSAMPLWLKEKLHMPREIKKALGGQYTKKIVFPGHHESHAASAFFPSPFHEAAILTIDGVGEWDTSTIGSGKDNKIQIHKSLQFPHSLGLLYSAFTYFTGFRVNSGEYKLMGLAPYGYPKYKDVILNELLDLKDDGSFAMDMDFFNYCQGLTMTNDRFAKLFDGPPRKSESDISEREMDLAASVQVVTQEIVLRMARYAKDITGMNNLCLAGGVALNCVANGKLLREKIFDQIWIQPAAGDAGGALGAAIFVHHQLLESERIVNPVDSMQGSLLGPRHRNRDIKKFLEGGKIPHHFYEKEEDLLDNVAGAISSEKVVGWFQDRMEFGPRALGARSIIGDARSEKMQSQMNLRIKFRESFRPFAPSVISEDVNEYFDLNEDSPYMLIVAPIQESIRTELSEEDEVKMKDPNLIQRVNVKRSTLPAVTHVDMSARVQTVDEVRNPRYYRLIKKFKEKTGHGVIINTSFNIRGEPIVCSPADAYRCFISTDMDVLVLENYVLLKTEQPEETKEAHEAYIKSFKLD